MCSGWDLFVCLFILVGSCDGVNGDSSSSACCPMVAVLAVFSAEA